VSERDLLWLVLGISLGLVVAMVVGLSAWRKASR